MKDEPCKIGFRCAYNLFGMCKYGARGTPLQRHPDCPDRIMEKVCEKCLERNDKCTNEEDNCCIMELKYRKPSANVESIFYFCCILMCGFNKHRCGYCNITLSGIIRFVKVDKIDPLPHESQKTLLQGGWEITYD